jgi:hypothetical protein
LCCICSSKIAAFTCWASAMTFLRSGRSLLAPRGYLLEHGNDLVAGTPGERPRIPFLALARLVVGRDAAIDGHLSQLNPCTFKSENAIIYAANRSSASVSEMATIPDMCFLGPGDPSDSQWVSCGVEHRVGEAFLSCPLPAMAWALAGTIQRRVRGESPILAAHAPVILFSAGMRGARHP